MNKKRVLTYAVIGALLVAAYFINVEVQSLLGRRALAATGLQTHGLKEALEKAGTESKWVLADLSAIWCPSCRAFDRNVLGDPSVKKAINRNFVFARIEYESEQGKAFQKRYGVSGFPNLLILDAQGEMIEHLPLTLDPQAFRRLLESDRPSGRQN